MKQIKIENIVVVGSGLAGKLAAIFFSKTYKTVTILDKNFQLESLQLIDKRDQHTHFCAAGALIKYKLIIPSIVSLLKSHGFYIGDPGVDISWGTKEDVLPKTRSNCLCGFGSYKSFLGAVDEIISSINNIKFTYGISDVKLIGTNIVYFYQGIKITIQHPITLIASGGKNDFLLTNNISSQIETYIDPCHYHSFNINLSSPLENQIAFLSEATPGVKEISFSFVPRTKLTGILTLGSFGNDNLNINNIHNLKELLSLWSSTLPKDFISKIKSISSQSDYINSLCYHRTLSSKHDNLFLIGDALLKVSPYTGLGFAATIESITSLIQFLENSRENTKNNLTHALIFKQNAKEIINRADVYRNKWRANPHTKINFSPKKFFLSYIYCEFFKEALVNKSIVATRFLVRVLHLIQKPSPIMAVFLLIRVKLHRLLYRKAREQC